MPVSRDIGLLRVGLAHGARGRSQAMPCGAWWAGGDWEAMLKASLAAQFWLTFFATSYQASGEESDGHP